MRPFTAEETAELQTLARHMEADDHAALGDIGMEKLLRINRFEQMREYLVTLFGPYEGRGYIELRAILAGKPPRRHFLPVASITDPTNKDSLKEAYRWAHQHDAQGFGIYCGVLPRSAERGRAEDVHEAAFAWCDADFKLGTGTTEDERDTSVMARIASLKTDFYPDMIVLSGFGMHLYWQLTTVEDISTRPAQERFRKTVRGFQQHVQPGTDSVQDTARVLRLPGFHNQKRKGDPRAVTVAWSPFHGSIATSVALRTESPASVSTALPA